MLSDLDALLATVLDRPEDDLPRLVYADKLEERDGPGDAARAEFIRVAIESYRMDLNFRPDEIAVKRFMALLRRRDTLFAAHGER